MTIYKRVDRLESGGELWMVTVEGLDRYRRAVVLPKDQAFQLMELYIQGFVIETNYDNTIESITLAEQVVMRAVPIDDIKEVVARRLLLDNAEGEK